MVEANDGRVAALSHVARCLKGDPHDLPCFIELIGYVRTSKGAFTARQQEGKRTTGVKLSDYLTTAMRWVAIPRTSAAFAALVATSCACSTVQRATPMHVAGQRALLATKHRWAAVCFAEQLLGTVLLSCAHAPDPDALARMDRIPHRRAWPTRIAELLPYGPEDTTRALFRWLAADRGGAGPELLMQPVSVFLSFTRPVSMPYMLTSRALVPDGVLALLKYACDTSDAQHDHLTAATCKGIMMALSTAATVATDVFISWADDVQRRAVLTKDDAGRLLSACNRAKSVCGCISQRPGVDQDVLQVTLRQLGMVGVLLLHDHPDFRPHIAPEYASYYDACYAINTWERTLTLARRLSTMYNCAAPDCTNTFANAGPFKCCGGCKRALYCSRGCQSSAWTHAVVPHSRICKTLRKVCPIDTVPRRHDAFDELSIYKPPDGFDESLAGEILAHFNATTTYQMQCSRA
jgi:hypothetical protein